MERGCEEIQLYSTWQHRPPASLAGSQLTALFVVACLLALLAVAAAVIWRSVPVHSTQTRDTLQLILQIKGQGSTTSFRYFVEACACVGQSSLVGTRG